MEKHLPDLNKLFSQYQEIKLVYLFGSQAKNQGGPLSDFDFALYFDEKATLLKKKDIVLDLNFRLSSILKTNNIDIVILNDSLSPLLKFNIINDGKLFYEKTPYKLLVEPQIFDQYFDFKVFQKTYNL